MQKQRWITGILVVLLVAVLLMLQPACDSNINNVSPEPASPESVSPEPATLESEQPQDSTHPPEELSKQSFQTTGPVVFPDENLDAIIREELNKAPDEEITIEELSSITSIRQAYAHVSDLTGIQYLSSLTSLDLMDSRIVDITHLASLTSLVTLGLYGNDIIDICSLAQLTNLEILNLTGNHIIDITPLKNLTNLKDLSLSRNQIRDITSLSSLTSLEKLWLNSNQIDDISALTSLRRLTWLQLGDNRITDISSLSELTGLTWLYLSENNISDISSLSSLTNLNWLWLQSNHISDISPIIANPGIGAGDQLFLDDNNLDLSEGSEDVQDIEILQDRGVELIPNLEQDLQEATAVDETSVLVPTLGLNGFDLTDQRFAQNTAEWVTIMKKTASSSYPTGAIYTHFEKATGNISLSGIRADVDLEAGKSFMYMTQWPPEVEEIKRLYIPLPQKMLIYLMSENVTDDEKAATMEDIAVYICPNATSLEEVHPSSPGTVFLELGESVEGMEYTTIIHDGRMYYLVFGFTGGGGGVYLPPLSDANGPYSGE